MTRGNQRELARLKNLKKQQDQKKSAGANNKNGNQGVSTENRMTRDAEAMRLKQAAAEARKAADAAKGQGDSKKVQKFDPLK
uniref:4F5 domain-containing protein n=1 Tax=Steinernema glaseri TaxID=37863 RepID=A0A1I8A8K1_9BILA